MAGVITAFINADWGSDVVVVAVDEDALILASHISSSVTWAKRDIGVSDVAGRGTWKDDTYAERYPDGWVVEWTEDPERVEALAAKASLREEEP